MHQKSERASALVIHNPRRRSVVDEISDPANDEWSPSSAMNPASKTIQLGLGPAMSQKLGAGAAAPVVSAVPAALAPLVALALTPVQPTTLPRSKPSMAAVRVPGAAGPAAAAVVVGA